MEVIEHLDPQDTAPILAEIRRVLCHGGQLFGSSAFPATRAEADALCAQNPEHQRVYTPGEWTDALRREFGNGKVIGDLLFHAVR